MGYFDRIMALAAQGNMSEVRSLLRRNVYTSEQRHLLLISWAFEGNHELCELVLANTPPGTEPVRANRNRSRALGLAAEQGHMQVAQLLLSQAEHPAEADADNDIDDYGEHSPLCLAAEAGHLAMCELLLGQAVHPARADALDSEALILAAAHGHLAVCKLLLSQAEHPAQANADDHAALRQAELEGFSEVCSLLRASYTFGENGGNGGNGMEPL